VSAAKKTEVVLTLEEQHAERLADKRKAQAKVVVERAQAAYDERLAEVREPNADIAAFAADEAARELAEVALDDAKARLGAAEAEAALILAGEAGSTEGQ